MNFTKFSSSIIMFMFIIFAMIFNSSGTSLTRVQRASGAAAADEGGHSGGFDGGSRFHGYTTFNVPVPGAQQAKLGNGRLGSGFGGGPSAQGYAKANLAAYSSANAFGNDGGFYNGSGFVPDQANAATEFASCDQQYESYDDQQCKSYN